MYKEITPKKRFSNIIEKYWFSSTLKENNISTSIILPDCAMDIIFDFGEKTDINISGMMTKFMKVENLNKSLFFGVRFKPLGLNNFIFLDYNNLKNEVSNIKETISEYRHAKLKKIFLLNFEDENQIIDTFENMLSELISLETMSRIDTDVKKIIEVINQNNVMYISDMIKDIYISQRQLEIKFKRDIGISMKEFLNIKNS